MERGLYKPLAGKWALVFVTGPLEQHAMGQHQAQS